MDADAPVNWTNPGVPEYVSNAETAVLVVYGFLTYTLVGALNGPSLWFEFATLNFTVFVLFPVKFVWIVPVTVSPTWNTPDFIDISISLGKQYLVTLIPSKNANNFDCGLKPLPSKVMFLDLIIVIASLLIVLSPRDSWSNVSVINSLVPCLVEVPISVLVIVPSSRVSRKRARLPLLLPMTVLFLVWIWEVCSTPVQTVCQPPQTVSVKPVWGSNPLSSASATTLEKFPSVGIIFGSNLTVSTQVSDAGVKSNDPVQKLSINGVTLSDLVPNGWLKYTVSS